jgi:signal transduction histidine kinase
MKKTRIIWKLYRSYIFLVLFAAFSITWYFNISLRQFHINQTAEQIELYTGLASSVLQRGGSYSLLSGFPEKRSIRLTRVGVDGSVLYDSDKPVEGMDNHLLRPEIADALKGERSVVTRFSNTLQKEMIYVALPLKIEGKVDSVLRGSMAVKSISQELYTVHLRVAGAAVLTSLIGFIFAFILSVRISKPLKQMESTAAKYARGNFSTSIELSSIKELSDLGISLNGMASELERLENIRKDFVANVSHELKTPITSIKGYVETLRDGAVDDKENVMGFLDIISRQTSRLTNIIEDLLALSRIEKDEHTGDILFEMEPLLPVIESAIMTCRGKKLNRDVAVPINCSEDISAKINSRMIEQAVVNLVDNALKYTDKGVVSVSVYRDDTAVNIAVVDGGVGIPQEHLPRLFERFYRVDRDRSRERGGTGLGLAIVKHIAKLHGGTVSVKSREGEGSTFTIHLPINISI